MILVRSRLLGLLIACAALPAAVCANGPDTGPPSPSTPWFTGTLLSTSGKTVSEGHLVINPYGYSTRYGAVYHNSFLAQSAVATRTNIQQTWLLYGLTNAIDVAVGPQWVGNHTAHADFVGFGDFPLRVGFQVMRDSADLWRHDIRVWVQETFPTGSYNNLSPASEGTSATGGGSYATTLAIAAQKAIDLTGDQVLRYRVNATYGFYSPVNVQGFNAYGGGFGTIGRVDPGSVTSWTLSGEYAVTRHVAIAVDMSFQIINASRFSGSPGVTASGVPASVGKGYSDLITLAPALEYSWNQNLGIIAGPWMSLTGRNTQEFFGFAAAIYLFL